MQCHRTAPYTALVTSETTHRLQAHSFELQGEAEWKSSYLASLISDYVPSRSLRSSDKQLLSRPFTSLVMTDKAFSVSAPKIWNDLSFKCRVATCVNSFKHNLKCKLFSIAYADHSQ